MPYVPRLHDSAQGLVAEVSSEHLRTKLHAYVIYQSEPCSKNPNYDSVDMLFQERRESLCKFCSSQRQREAWQHFQQRAMSTCEVRSLKKITLRRESLDMDTKLISAKVALSSKRSCRSNMLAPACAKYRKRSMA